MSENVRILDVDGKQARALGVLLGGGDMAAAAQAADVTERTLRRWRQDAEFADALAAGQRAALEDAAMRAAALAAKALDALGEIAGDGAAAASDRIRAASALLNAVLPLTGEAASVARVAALENRLRGN